MIMKTFTKLNIIALFVIIGLNSFAVNVTFRVDMSQQTVAVEGVHIAGSFQDWDPGATIMADMGNNIYSFTTDLTSGETIEYKFINGDEWGEDETVPSECAQNNNRFLAVPNDVTILDAVCYGSCAVCGDPVNITFQVDMSEQDISPQGIHITGSMQGWDPSSTEMTDIGDNVYSVTLTIMSNETIQYKFINGVDWPESELVPEACGVPDGFGAFNREFVVPGDDVTIDIVCFGTCFPCEYEPVEVQVTFLVDMSEETISTNGIHLTGSFQDWDPAATEMTNTGDSNYSVTLPLWSGDSHQYKFINGSDWEFEESVPGNCGIDNGSGGFNRFFTVPEVDTTFSIVCFSSCEPCFVGIAESSIEQTIISPNPFSNQLKLDIYLRKASGIHLEIFDVLGNQIETLNKHFQQQGLNSININTENLRKGIYIYYLSTGDAENFKTGKLIKK
jgi:hypothetical protein